MNILNIFKRDRKREIVGRYVAEAALEICSYLRALEPGAIGDFQARWGFQIFAHNRLFMPTEIANDFESLLRRRTNDNGEAAKLAARMRAYAKRYW